MVQSFTKGELQPLYFKGESVYGVIPTDALLWGVDIETIRWLNNMNVDFIAMNGSRAHGATTRGPYDIGFGVRGYARKAAGGYNWTVFFAFGLGTASGPTTPLSFFTTQLDKKVGATHYYNIINGCKFNRLTIEGTEPGKKLVFDGEIWGQWVQSGTSKTITGKMQDVTVGADPSAETGDVLTWAAPLQIDLAAAGKNNFYPRNWKFTITQGLSRQPGHKTGEDGVKYPVALALDEGTSEYMVEFLSPYGDETYTDAKTAGTAVTSITIPIDDELITLTDGDFVADDYPEYKQDVMDETVKIKFKDFSIA